MANTSNVQLKHITLNVRGIRDKKKRSKIFFWLKNRKYDVIFLQETFLTIELEKDVKKDWNGYIEHNFSDSVHSRGVSILLNSDLDVNIVNVHKSADGIILLINLIVNGESFTFVNIYAPNKTKMQSDFFKRISSWIPMYSQNSNNILIAGDMNCSVENKTIWKHFEKFKNHLNLADAWDNVNKTKPCFTWINPADESCQSRLDYTLTSKFLVQYATLCKTSYAPTPDHLGLETQFKISLNPRGPSYWKLNVSILNEDPYNELVRTVIKNTKTEYENILCKRSLWDLIKIRIKEISIKFCVEKQRKKKAEIGDLEKRLEKIESEIRLSEESVADLKSERSVVKNTLDRFYAEKAKACQIRARAKWIEEGEKNTAYFLQLEKRRQTYNTITKLQTESGEIVASNKDILNTASEFYEDLYSSKIANSENLEHYLSKCYSENVLSQNESKLCEGLMNENECYEALTKMKKNKSPGSDGIPVEFYIHFWADIKNLVIDSFNESFYEGSLSESQNLAILSLIFKKSDRLLLKNYRPISLSNTDYKILACTLAYRLHKVLKMIISQDQTGYVKQRFIGQNIRAVEDVIDYYENKLEIGGLVIFLDFEKAFDSLEWKFMFQTLEKFGFSTDFVNWIKTIYNSPTAIIKNNGWLSQKINLQRGIKQGCPLSALLFIIATEILSINLKQKGEIKGLGINKHELKLVQYADDMILFLESENGLSEALSTINEFTAFSGLKLNLAKTEGIRLGCLRNTSSNFTKVKWTENAVRCLGIYVGHNKIECEKINWTNKVIELQKLLDQWRVRDLTIFGKVTIIKSLALSKLVYSATNTHMPQNIEKEIERILYAFIWNKKDRIKRNVMIAPIKFGGVNMIDVGSFFASIKTSWIARLIKNETCTWNAIGRCHLNIMGKENLLLETTFTKIENLPIIKNMPLFYQQMIIAYNKCKPFEKIKDIETLMKQPIWGNASLRLYDIKKKIWTCLYYRQWVINDIIYIKDLPFKQGILDVDVINDRIQKNPQLLIEMHRVQLCLNPFKQILKDHNSSGNTTNKIEGISVFQNSKLNYNFLISQKLVLPNMKHIKQFLNDTGDPRLLIEKMSKQKIVSLYEKKLAEFIFKVMHNILGCGALVSKWNTEISEFCDICNRKETTFHLLYKCQLSHYIWTNLGNHLNTVITPYDIFIGRGSKVFDNLTTQICHSIYKYRLKSWESKQKRTECGLKIAVRNDLAWKLQVFQILRENEYVLIMQNIIKHW